MAAVFKILLFPLLPDVRITTRYSSNLVEGLTGTIHETGNSLPYHLFECKVLRSSLIVGHALYEQGRNPEYIDLPVGHPVGMG